jgi:hypothetical protein
MNRHHHPETKNVKSNQMNNQLACVNSRHWLAPCRPLEISSRRHVSFVSLYVPLCYDVFIINSVIFDTVPIVRDSHRSLHFFSIIRNYRSSMNFLNTVFESVVSDAM